MKKLLVSAGVAGLLFAGAGSALAAELGDGGVPEPTPGVANANQNACFGQSRAGYSRAGFNGETISQRKGTNPQNNADYIADYC